MGVFKMDWALSEPIPFTAKDASGGGTVHLGNIFEEIAYSEKITSVGKHADKPYVLLSQPSQFDKTRAPQGKHTAWAYCHVPNGSQKDMTGIIENQIERFAPGFKDTILKRSTLNTRQMQEYNPNYIGGDVNGGLQNLAQLYSRPVLSLSLTGHQTKEFIYVLHRCLRVAEYIVYVDIMLRNQYSKICLAAEHSTAMLHKSFQI
jgi:phytoene dehydrogenase-like protein